MDFDIECNHDLRGFALIVGGKEQVGFRFVDCKVLTLPGGGHINRVHFEGPTLDPPSLPLVFGPRPPHFSGNKPDWTGEICVSGQALAAVAYRQKF
ncbi:hypothetical protein G4G28_17820 [Massilia sp. Dwa41.01b]|uniref:hypothetical protein n=1 Tax=unclassified Massilia TaxID=2609279 RepID=UPI001601A696|nr:MULTISPECIES: hypothetical protein [unclassified Massilia]QNA89887.1 hypothetical protein G4G28_17820 [Massilia sp. Dwa41.01b]QNB00773.1 hypothetical protein G4G31_21380 [Massilia sp. Se16.2.3]